MDRTEPSADDLSTLESHALAQLTDLSQSVITTTDVESALDVHPRIAREMAATLSEKGQLVRIADGRYLVLPPDVEPNEVTDQDQLLVGASLVEPTYVSFLSALEYHGLVDQKPDDVYVVTTRNEPDRTVLGVTYHLVPLITRKFFGFEQAEIRGEQVNIASVEKALVDCADHPKFCGGIDELAQAMVKAEEAGCSWDTVVTYLKKVDNGAATKRILFAADELGIDIPGRTKILANVTRGYSPLDPTREPAGSYDSTYRLLVNADLELYRPEHPT